MYVSDGERHFTSVLILSYGTFRLNCCKIHVLPILKKPKALKINPQVSMYTYGYTYVYICLFIYMCVCARV